MGLSDFGRRCSKLVECPKEPAVGFVTPPDVTASTPTTPAQAIESTVVPDARCGIALHGVPSEFAEARPSIEERWVVGDDRRDGVSSCRNLVDRSQARSPTPPATAVLQDRGGSLEDLC